MTPDVVLVPMSEEDFQRFQEITTREYAEENVQAGYWSEGEALQRSREELRKLLPHGMATPHHHFFIITEEGKGQRAGHIWLRVEEGQGGRTGFIFAIFIDARWRGRGMGTATMRALDRLAVSIGLQSLGLHVFASNTVARHLYERSGYTIRSMNMIKELRKDE
jgi:ribosomal protein S18 acetylase RimI-like enzyme